MSDLSHTSTLRVVVPAEVGTFGVVLTAIADAGGQVGGVALVASTATTVTREITVHTATAAGTAGVIAALEGVGATIETTSDPILAAHEGGAIGMQNRVPVRSRDDLSMAYTPGVARVCLAIHDDFEQAWQYTIKANSVLVTSDGSAVAGLGDLGAEASLPACEATCLMLRDRAGIDAFPLPVDRERDPEKVAEIIHLCSSVFAGIHLTDIDPDRVGPISAALAQRLDVPVFADETDGVAVAAVAAAQNAATLAGVGPSSARVALVGSGPAREATARLLAAAGIETVTDASAATATIDFSDAEAGTTKVVVDGVASVVNAHLGYPGIWRAVLDCRASSINDAMLLAAAGAIAETLAAPSRDELVPSALADDLADNVAGAVRNAADATGVARLAPAV